MSLLMTRAEAIDLIKQHTPKIFDATSIIDFYIAAGMLKVKEEEITNYLTIKDIDGDIQKVDIAELILKLNLAGFEVKKK